MVAYRIVEFHSERQLTKSVKIGLGLIPDTRLLNAEAHFRSPAALCLKSVVRRCRRAKKSSTTRRTRRLDAGQYAAMISGRRQVRQVVGSLQLRLRSLELMSNVHFPLCVQQRDRKTVINPEDDVCYDLRVSCTEEEAVAKLLGWMQGVRRLRNLTVTLDGLIPEQLQHMYQLPAALDELIKAEREIASIRFSNACVEKNFDRASEWEARVEYWDAMAELAIRYKQSIFEELSRPKPNLQIDQLLTEQTGEKHLTLVSLDHWTRKKFGITILDQASQASAGDVPDLLKGSRSKAQEQESAIVELVVQLGYNPLKLPPRSSGKPGTKRLVRVRLNLPSPLFPSHKVFEKAWERLRNDRQLIEEEVSPKIDQGGTLVGEDS